jgi:hypothetical protein
MVGVDDHFPSKNIKLLLATCVTNIIHFIGIGRVLMDCVKEFLISLVH